MKHKVKVFSKHLSVKDFAKYAVLEKGLNAVYWIDMTELDHFHEFTQEEIDVINAEIDKQLYRLKKFLGFYKIAEKLWDRE